MPGSTARTAMAGAFGLLSMAASPLEAAGIPTAELEPLVVIGEADGLYGPADSATEGVVLTEQIEQRPVSRPGELLEFVPGLIATQHSGEGKANQYFLRGFNLDHGTDFAITVEGLPVNMPSHGHGQGYADLSFMIPELVETLAYRKGVYYADVGNFSAAGSAAFEYVRRLDAPSVQLAVGENDYRQAFAATSFGTAGGDLLLGIESTRYDGAWQLPQDLSQDRGVIKYTRGDAWDGYTLTLMGYDGEWRSPDQIPLRAVESGAIDALGFIDPYVGGESSRYSASFDWRRGEAGRHWSLAGYAIDYELDLWSNFTYFLEDPVDGDEFEQLDDRRIYGLSGHLHRETGAERVRAFSLGFDLRHDEIDQVGLYATRARERLATVREDSVGETALGLWAEADVRLSERLRAVLGIRADHYRFDVEADLAVNSGSRDDSIASPKLSLVYSRSDALEIFLNAGRGFHSNDARGTTIRVDPTDGLSPADPVDPLVPATGFDLGLRAALQPELQLAASVWALELDSELVYVGDGGATEPSDASERYGAELALFWTPAPWLIVDADLAWTRARFDIPGPDDRIPGAVERVASLGITMDDFDRLSAGLRLRYLGPAPLIEDGSVRSESTTVLNGQVTWAVTPAVSLRVEGFNLLDSDDADITYFYASRLPGEPAEGVEDVHFHPVEPRHFRLTLMGRF